MADGSPSATQQAKAGSGGEEDVCKAPWGEKHQQPRDNPLQWPSFPHGEKAEVPARSCRTCTQHEF